MTTNPSPEFFHASPVALEIANYASTPGRIEGYASTFGGPPDHGGRIILAGAFKNTIAAHRAAGSMPAMLWSHDLAQPIGRWIHLEEDAVGLKAVGQLNLRTSRGQEAYQHIRAGDAVGLSIGWNPRPGGMRVDHASKALVFSDADLFEVSAVTIPANSRAQIRQVASIGSRRELEQLLRSNGLSRAAALQVASHGWSALETPDRARSEADAALAARVRHATQALQRMKRGQG